MLTLNDGCGTCGWIPENFLEESQPQPEAVQKPKGRQRKGCLYKYIENKKLKSGAIASYPRVIGHRQPDNPTHWRSLMKFAPGVTRSLVGMPVAVNYAMPNSRQCKDVRVVQKIFR
ncbi:hypothetical protein LC612_33460 [Nostoc sp. CHAB 5834]|nr:hypothetical protein [Nostoc sp. CHAB 5834]